LTVNIPVVVKGKKIFIVINFAKSHLILLPVFIVAENSRYHHALCICICICHVYHYFTL